MKPIILFVALIGITPCFCNTITPEIIASSCSADSGRTSEQYYEYGVKLAKTLDQFSAEELSRIFASPTIVSGSRNTESNPIPESLANGNQTLNEFLDLAPINFGGASSELTSESTTELDRVFVFLNENPNTRIMIEGHSSISDSRSQRISDERAAAAREYLIGLGIDESRIESVGRNFDEPIYNDRHQNELNRRIEIELIQQ